MKSMQIYEIFNCLQQHIFIDDDDDDVEMITSVALVWLISYLISAWYAGVIYDDQEYLSHANQESKMGYKVEMAFK